MKWSESKSGCKEHPNDKQVPGVCSSCLRDKLAQLIYVDSTNKPTQMDHPLQCFDTRSLSPQPQPQTKPISSLSSASYRRRHRRNASDVIDSVLVSSMLSFNHGLNKSRSLAFASRSQGRDRNLNGVCGRKRNGFWSKLIKLTGKGTKEPSMHSMTLREPRA